jgi:hypothetical protein
MASLCSTRLATRPSVAFAGACRVPEPTHPYPCLAPPLSPPTAAGRRGDRPLRHPHPPAAKPQRAARLVVRAEEVAAAAPKAAAKKKEVGPKRGSFVSIASPRRAPPHAARQRRG